MKQPLLITLVSCTAATAMAGTPQEVVPAPAPAETLGGWFVGGTYGQINDGDNLVSGVGSLLGLVGGIGSEFPLLEGVQIGDLDFDVYSLHVGRQLDEPFLGCKTSAYLEVAYLDGGLDINVFDGEGFSLAAVDIDLKIIPVTANLKLERQIFGDLSAYVTGGIGFAYTDGSISGLGQSLSSDDIEFYAQISFGLAYHVTDNWDIYGGMRWVRLSDMDFGTSIPVELVDDQFAWEIGARYNF